MARNFSGSATETGLAISSVYDKSRVSMTRRPAARSARPVSVISTTASAMSGIFASVAPKEKRTSASTPRSAKKRLVSTRVLGRDPAPGRQVLDFLRRGVPGHGEHDLDRICRDLGVLQLAQADDLGSGLLNPVAPGHPQVEQALGHITRDLLGPQDMHLGHTRIVDRRPVGDIGGTANGKIGSREQLEGRLLERTLRQNQAQHRLGPASRS